MCNLFSRQYFRLRTPKNTGFLGDSSTRKRGFIYLLPKLDRSVFDGKALAASQLQTFPRSPTAKEKYYFSEARTIFQRRRSGRAVSVYESNGIYENGSPSRD